MAIPKIGDLSLPVNIAPHATSQVTADWKWHDETQGLVEWTFANPTNEQKSVILLRNGYYFGNAFWPVYDANPEFSTHFMKTIVPLTDDGTANNSPPLSVVLFPNGRYIACFVFTLSAGQTWSMLEGGFSSSITPSGISTYDLTPYSAHNLCIGYDQQQVSDWDSQTDTSLQGYSPNPKTFEDRISFAADAPFVELFADSISTGICGSGNNGSQPSSCVAMIEGGIKDDDLTEIVEGVQCLLKQYGLSKLQTKIESFGEAVKTEITKILSDL